MFKVWILNSKGLKSFLAADFTLRSSQRSIRILHCLHIKSYKGLHTNLLPEFLLFLWATWSLSTLCWNKQHAEPWESHQASIQPKNNPVRKTRFDQFFSWISFPNKFSVLLGEQPWQQSGKECLFKQKCCQTCSCGLNRQARENRKKEGGKADSTAWNTQLLTLPAALHPVQALVFILALPKYIVWSCSYHRSPFLQQKLPNQKHWGCTFKMRS